MVAAFPVMAQEATADAGATLLSPLSISSAEPLEFGELVIPAAQQCTYLVLATGPALATGPGDCQFLGGDRFPARFRVACNPGTLVQFEVIHTDLAPAGASFSAPSQPLVVDAHGAGAPFRLVSCDADGLSEAAAGGVLVVSATAQPFSGTVGTIRLEVAYE